jgi:hypothetical protein
MTTPGVVWPVPEELFDWLGEANLSRDGQTQHVTAVEANAVHSAYSQWLEGHRGACTELETLKKKMKTMQGELTKAQERTNRLIDESLLRTPASQGTGTSVVHRIKPRQPSPFDGSQDLEVVTRFLDEVEHYVRQGASACPSTTLDNQLIDTVWRFLSVKTFRWFELEMSRRGIDTIPPANHDYGITWKSVKVAFRAQFVPVVAVSVVRKQWHALKFNRNEVLTFNRRALELIEILGGSLKITRDDPLWEEYLLKLPEMLSRDVTQQAQMTRRISKEDLTLGDMMEVVTERTLPYLPAGTTGSRAIGSSSEEMPATTPVHQDPMDLSNLEDAELNTIDRSVKCYRCLGFGHVARQCGTPSSTDRSMKFRVGKEASQRDNWRRDSTDRYGKSTTTKHHKGGSHVLTKGIRNSDQVRNRRINTINDNKESHAGSYYPGNWADNSSASEPEEEDTDEEMNMERGGKGDGKQAKEEGSVKGEGKAGKGKQ